MFSNNRGRQGIGETGCVEADGSVTSGPASRSRDLPSADRPADVERQVAYLRAAVESRQLIGTAVGVLAERFDTTPDQAWELLRWVSQTVNVKVRLIAEAVVAQRAGAPSTAERDLLASIAGLLPRSPARNTATGVLRSWQRPDAAVMSTVTG